MHLKIYFNILIVFFIKLLLLLKNETEAQYKVLSTVTGVIFIVRFLYIYHSAEVTYWSHDDEVNAKYFMNILTIYPILTAVIIGTVTNILILLFLDI